jgi:hypothetical protein
MTGSELFPSPEAIVKNKNVKRFSKLHSSTVVEISIGRGCVVAESDDMVHLYQSPSALEKSARFVKCE